VNLLVAIISTLILRAARVDSGQDATSPDDYFVDEGSPRVTPGDEQIPEPVPAA
jgi:SSS family solute:Na+ symporter